MDDQLQISCHEDFYFFLSFSFFCFIYFKMRIVEHILHYFGYWMENNRQVHIQTTGWGTRTLSEVKPFFPSASKITLFFNKFHHEASSFVKW